MMNSLITKLGMVTAIAAGRNLADMVDPEDVLTSQVNLLMSMVKDIQDVKESLAWVEQSVETLQDQQVTLDYYYLNDDWIVLPKGQQTKLQSWTVKAGETMNLDVKLDTLEDALGNKKVWMWLEQDGEAVVKSMDDGDGGNGTSVVVMNYRTRVPEDKDSVFNLRVKATGFDHKISPQRFQLGYTTYGPRHNFAEMSFPM